MNDNSPMQTGRYAEKVSKRALKIEKCATRNRVRRIVLLLLMIIACAGGIIYGVSSKSDDLENLHRQFLESPERSNLNRELMAYDDIFDSFVRDYLGNAPWQSLMGGYFYSNAPISIYPQTDPVRTMISINGEESVLSDTLADNINVRGNTVVFRDPVSRKIFKYDIKTHETELQINENVGQLVVCGDEYYYIDLSRSALIQYNRNTVEKTVLVEDSVASFVVSGNEIIYLDTEHTLRCYNLMFRTNTVISQNITAFSYNGKIWFQNNNVVYQKRVGENRITGENLGMRCNRLLGVTGTSLIFESEDGVYIHDLTQHTNKKAGTGVFIGASEYSILFFDIDNSKYDCKFR